MTIHADLNPKARGYMPRPLTKTEEEIEALWLHSRQKVRALVETWVEELVVKIGQTSSQKVDDYVRFAHETVDDCYKREISPFAAVDEIRQCLIDLGLCPA
ncbi:MAG TPA: hypothetical protein VMH91_02760 [Candidatus Paceibacterota bacterium]|nr:hypothetical protein [Candidatus Paceibacterota bacterium]